MNLAELFMRFWRLANNDARGHAILLFLADQNLLDKFMTSMRYGGPDYEKDDLSDPRITDFFEVLSKAEPELKNKVIAQWLAIGWLVKPESTGGDYRKPSSEITGKFKMSPAEREAEIERLLLKTSIKDIQKVLLVTELVRLEIQEGAGIRASHIKQELKSRGFENIALAVPTHLNDMMKRESAPELERFEETLPRNEISVRITEHGFNKINDMLS